MRVFFLNEKPNRMSVFLCVFTYYVVGSFVLSFLINSFANLSPSRNFRAFTYPQSIQKIKTHFNLCSKFNFNQ